MQHFDDTSETFVDDVYDLAAVIGKEFEAIIAVYGAEAVSKLMPQVISVLERLESTCLQKDDQQLQLCHLQSKISDLEKEKQCKAANRIKYESELEQIEELWRSENSSLNDMLKKLKDDNEKLHSFLRIDSNQSSTCDCAEKNEEQQLSHLRNQISKYKSQLEQFTEDYDCKLSEINKIQEQFQLANQQIKDLKKLNQEIQMENNNLREENQDLQSKLEEQNNDLLLLKEKLGVAIKENMDLALSGESSGHKDNSTPKFSLIELRNILFERNSLKSEVRELREELSSRKNSNVSNCNKSPTHRPSDDLPVHGPINREPDEKLFPNRKRSTILRL